MHLAVNKIAGPEYGKDAATRKVFNGTAKGNVFQFQVFTSEGGGKDTWKLMELLQNWDKNN